MRWLKQPLRLQPITATCRHKFAGFGDRATLFRRWTTLAQWEYLPTAIRTAVRAGMMRESRLLALRTDFQLWNLDLVMLAPVALARVGLTFLW